MKKLAQIVSLFLGIPWVLVIIWMLIFQTELEPAQIRFFSFVFPILHFAVPLSFLLWWMHTGRISDIDITKREERYGILSVVFAKNVISLVLIWLYGNALLLHIALAVFGAFTAAFFITFIWKISLHMTFNTVGVTLVNVLNDWEFMWLYALLPVVFWSRYILKKHTVGQLTAGFVVSESIMLGVLMYFGLV